jgi:branched-chain amino acid transport system substrate-binding protein
LRAPVHCTAGSKDGYVSIVASEYTTGKAVGFNAQLTNIKAVNADLLFFVGFDNQAGLLIKRIKQFGMQTQCAGSGGIADSIFICAVFACANYSVGWHLRKD